MNDTGIAVWQVHSSAFFKKYPPSCPFYGNFLTYSTVI